HQRRGLCCGSGGACAPLGGVSRSLFSLAMEAESRSALTLHTESPTDTEFPNTSPLNKQLVQIGRSAVDATAMPSKARIWVLRILVIVGIVSLCLLADSSVPAFALALTWGPNG